MNSKFREIACKAGFSMSQAYSAEFNEFSELLIKEVLSVFDKVGEYDGPYAPYINGRAEIKIKKHFGIQI